jgi:putative ABC transport system permease protein
LRAMTGVYAASVQGRTALGPNSGRRTMRTEVQWLDEAFSATLSRERLNAVVSVAFGLSALLLASLGIYGLLAFVVTERTREIGVRMALGARRSTVLQMVLSHGLRMVAAGAFIGLVAAFGMARFIESLLFGVTAHDPITLFGSTALLFSMAVVATLIPYRQATKIDPLMALRRLCTMGTTQPRITRI